PIWFKRGVQPLQLRALHIGDRFFASNWPQASRKKFLDWIQSQGYNTLSIASHFLNRDEADRGRDWKTPDLWPLNANEFQRMESILNDVHDRGLIVFPFAGFIGKNSDYPRDASDQEAYIRYTMSRLGHYGNLLYNVAGPEPNLKEDWFSDEDVNRLGRLIRDHDVYDHPLTVHNRTGDDPYRDSDWTTFGTLQGPKTVNRKKLHQGLMESHHPSKPLFAQETLWSGNMYHVKKRLGRDYSDDDIRKNAYVIHMSGANFCFADNQGNSSSGFSGSLDVDDAHPTRHQIINRVWDFFASIRYYEMSPRPDLVDEGFCLANPGKSYLVYLPEGGTVNLQMGLGNYRATWIHPNDTADRRDAGLTRHRGRFDAPSDGDDWLLLLTHQRTGLAEGIRLSWKDASDTTLTIAWKTDAPRAVGTRGLQNRVVASYRSLGQLEWREAKGNSKPMAGHGRLHRVTLRGLSPSTVYEYRLSNDDGLSPEWSDVHQSKTAPAANKPARFRVAFVADVGLSGRLDGNADGVEAVMQSVIEKNPTCVLGGGDYAYANRDGRFNSVGEAIDAFFEQYQPLLRRFPFQPQFGNHELKLVERIEDWSPQFSLPAGDPQSTSYSFDIADVHFTAFQLVDRPPTPEELAWLDQDLASARDRGQRWLVVYHHEPLYAYGRSHPSKTAIAEMVLPILEKHKVDLALNTHDQSYERTYPLIGHPSRPKVMASHPNRYLAGQGVVYCKVSPSGKRSEIGNTFSKFKVPQQDFMAVRDDTQHHYALIDFYESGQMVVTAYGIAPESQQEVIVDRFSVLQSIKP
ncbi:MAG: fibronectin type III domain-containing protein, partial [Planctomycetota bacterium]